MAFIRGPDTRETCAASVGRNAGFIALADEEVSSICDPHWLYPYDAIDRVGAI